MPSRLPSALALSPSMQIGDFIVYPGQGVGRIDGVEERTIGDVPCSFFNVHILETEDQILIPTARAADCGVRRTAASALATNALALFAQPPPDWTGVSWIQRSRHYETCVSKGELLEVASVFRDMLHMKHTGPLSFGQIKLLQRSRRMATHEIAIALERDSVEVGGLIEDAVGAALKRAAA